MYPDEKPQSLRVFVKLTSAEKLFAVEVRYSETVYAIKRQVQQQDATLLADSGMLLYEVSLVHRDLIQTHQELAQGTIQ